jgi:excisionase family DNA binding protein
MAPERRPLWSLRLGEFAMPNTPLPAPAARSAGAPWPVRTAAHFLAVSERHVWRLIVAGRVRAIRIGRRVLIPDAEVRRVAAEGA